ncbi:RING-H2 finger protein ATL72-like [Hibiscus syriacus]|uniref:RING-H2 finger protein ATL72-like n=1 Tax=Hibiscus syriacus TaxID=106335 RepID=UPI0019205149|nr:RING-H2 finger protein ATL72-like [Hibiscus syriacus]
MVALIVLEVRICLRLMNEIDPGNGPQLLLRCLREGANHPVVGVTQRRTNNEDVENPLPSHVIIINVVQQLNQTSRPTISGTDFRYKNGEIESHYTECSICLEEFKDGDSYRLLPNCKHLYHQPCIDQWLVKNRHCPLCGDSVPTQSP